MRYRGCLPLPSKSAILEARDRMIARHPRERFTDTFVRQNGQWRCVASHSSIIK